MDIFFTFSQNFWGALVIDTSVTLFRGKYTATESEQALEAFSQIVKHINLPSAATFNVPLLGVIAVFEKRKTAPAHLANKFSLLEQQLAHVRFVPIFAQHPNPRLHQLNILMQSRTDLAESETEIVPILAE
jgi:hypothetical protein